MQIFSILIVTLSLIYAMAAYSMKEEKTITILTSKTTWFPPALSPPIPKKPLYKEPSESIKYNGLRNSDNYIR